MLPGILVYMNDLHTFDGILSNEDLGAVIRALGEYIETGVEVSDLSPVAVACFRILKAKIDREAEKYQKKTEAGAKGGRPRKPTETKENQEKPMETKENQRNQKEKEYEYENEKENLSNTDSASACADAPTATKTKRFQKPSVDEIRAFCKEKDIGNVDAEAFVDHYEANGWKIGGKSPMKDWQAAVRNWARNDFGGNRSGSRKTVTAQQFPQRQYDGKQLDERFFGDVLRQAGVKSS